MVNIFSFLILLSILLFNTYWHCCCLKIEFKTISIPIKNKFSGECENVEQHNRGGGRLLCFLLRGSWSRGSCHPRWVRGWANQKWYFDMFFSKPKVSFDSWRNITKRPHKTAKHNLNFYYGLCILGFNFLHNMAWIAMHAGMEAGCQITLNQTNADAALTFFPELAGGDSTLWRTFMCQGHSLSFHSFDLNRFGLGLFKIIEKL